MDCFNIKELMSYQLAIAEFELFHYEDELSTILALHHDESFAPRRRMSKAWLSALNDKHEPNSNALGDAIKKAVQLREEGNKFYSAKGDAKQTNFIKAGQRYTQAIFAAPENSEALALAHANRAMVLQELEYYQQAYDDCCCALETKKYPQRLLQKIKARQAFCTLYLKDAAKLAVHLAELESCNLNENFAQHVQELRAGLETLTNEQKTDVNGKNGKEVPSADATQIIDTKEAIRGRYMIATKPIKTGDVIFSETACGFVPAGGFRMCELCGAMLIIPLPCHGCNGRVIYCSLKCRNANINVHQIECTGHRWGLFEQIGISFLALRVVLEELPSMMSVLANKADVRELWHDLTTQTELPHTQNNISYLRTLRMVTHLSKMPLSDITSFALLADLLIVYLKDYTKFFNCLNGSKLNEHDCELMTSALILRHIGQFIVNAHTCVSIIPTCYDILSSASNFAGMLLMPEIWTRPFHLRRGFLHVFGEFSEVSAVNFPYLSLCNHACAPTLRHKFSGRHFTALAESDIEKGAEIFNCYTSTYRNSLRDVRRDNLESTYNFKCTCVYCQRENPDSDYMKYHLYKCQNPKCRKEFVPSVGRKRSLIWWKTDDDSDIPLRGVSCPYCTKKQNVKWYQKFKHLLRHISSPEKRIELFHIYEMVDNILLGSHALKNTMGLDLSSSCVDAYVGGCEFTDGQLNKIVKILKFSLKCTADEFGLQSIEYAATMTFLWDLIAMNKYKPTQSEKADMLKALDVVSDEYRLLFLNYYQDYIDPEY